MTPFDSCSADILLAAAIVLVSIGIGIGSLIALAIQKANQ